MAHDNQNTSTTSSVSSTNSTPDVVDDYLTGTPGGGPPVNALNALLHVSPGSAAHRRIAKLAAALRDVDLVRINVEVNAVSTTALGVLPRIKALRPECVRRLPQHDMTLFDAFEDIVLALDYSDSRVRASVEEKRQLTAQAEALDTKRTQLHDFSEGMAAFGLLPKEPLKGIKTEFGYKPMLRDVSTLVELLTQNWATVGDKAPFTLEQLGQIAQEVLALRTAIGLKEQSPDGPREELVERRRVFTLFRMAVLDIRKIVIYLYGEDAVTDIVPSFFNAATKSSTKGSDTPTEGESNTTENEAPPTPTTSPVAAATKAVKGGVSGFTINNPLNLPITPPFENEDT